MTLFIFICFDVANDSEPPDSYLRYPLAWPVLVWGMHAHRKWHYTKGEPPPFFVKWFCRFRAWGPIDIVPDLWTRLVCMLTCAEMPWHVEACEAAEEEEQEEKEREKKELGGDASPITVENAIFADWEEASDREEEKEEKKSLEDMRESVAYKRRMTGIGLGAIYISWVRTLSQPPAAAH